MRTASRRIAFGLASLLAFGGAAAQAGSAHLVRDLETSATNAGSFPERLIVWRDHAYFIASDPVHGQEVWTTDGTREGTRVLRDVVREPSSGSTAIRALEAGEEGIWMALDDGVSGFELWASDGTPEGTRLVADLCPGTCGSDVGALFAWRDSVFFEAGSAGTGIEPWISDGTRDGTRLLEDVCPGACSSLPRGLARLGDLTLFTAADPEHGRELWRTDGTPEGTRLVADICPGDCTSFPAAPAVVAGGEAYFAAFDPDHGVELWKSDGTAQGTVLLGDLCPGLCTGDPRPFALGDKLLFTAQDREIWQSDGTAAGTSRVVSLPPDSLPAPLFPVVRNGAPPDAFLFVRYLNSGELWLTDGTAAGTRAVAEVEDFLELGAVAGNRLIFSGGPQQAHELWVSNGTAAGTRELKDLWAGPRGSSPTDFVSFGSSQVFFTAETRLGRELWITDGTRAGTRLVKDVSGPDASFRPGQLTAAGDLLYFTAGSGPYDEATLWVSDGTAEGTVLLDGSAHYGELTAVGDRLFFAAGTEDVAPQPGVTDGTLEGTRPLWDSSRPGSEAYGLVASGGVLYFAELGAEPGERLWRSDGSPEGTWIVKDLDPGFVASLCSDCGVPHCCGPPIIFPQELTAAAGGVYMVGQDPEHGVEIWKSDGTEAGTEVAVDLVPGPLSSLPADLTLVGDHLYFTAVTDIVSNERSLWRTDGTAAVPVATPPAPHRLTAVGDRLFFLVAGRRELFAADNGSDEAELVASFEVDGFPGFAGDLTAAGGRLFMAVFNEATGQELWTSDGTAAGTRRVEEISPGTHGSYPQSFAAVDGRLYFAADDGETGLELWTSDGTARGTCRLTDVAPGREPSSPAGFAAAGKRVFFAADDGVAGRELWAVPRKVLCGAGRP